jgi:hypothetical protein
VASAGALRVWGVLIARALEDEPPRLRQQVLVRLEDAEERTLDELILAHFAAPLAQTAVVDQPLGRLRVDVDEWAGRRLGETEHAHRVRAYARWTDIPPTVRVGDPGPGSHGDRRTLGLWLIGSVDHRYLASVPGRPEVEIGRCDLRLTLEN